MSDPEEDAIRRETLKRAIAVVQKYRDENYRRLRVNDICDEIMQRLAQEVLATVIAAARSK
jgi:hypothetical protein